MKNFKQYSKKQHMANKQEGKLFSEFPPVTTEQWEEVINADLKGADYEKKLVWKTMEGFNVRPYYRAENLASIKYLGSAPGQFPYARGVKDNNNWLVRQTIEVDSPKAANARALDALMKGADSISFAITKGDEFTADDMDILLGGIELKAIEVNFTGCSTAKVAELFVDKIKKAGYDPCDIRAGFDIDPIIKKLSLKGAFGCCEDGSKCFARIKSLVESAAGYKKIKFTGVNGKVFNDCGSTIVQELAFSLAAGHEYVVKLMDAGLDIDRAAGTVKFTMSVSSNYFMEIAKFRAGRMLWANIIKQYSPAGDCAMKMRVHASTSMWNMTVYDPYVNMLRGTTEAMSAAIAGVDSIEVLPFNAASEKPTEFSSRIARNTQLLLKEESHFDHVADASGGSYYIENLTQSIAEQAWKLFLEVEDKGGYIAAFEAGFIRSQIEDSAAKKNKNIATRREILLGTNQYPNFMEVIDKAPAEEKSCGCGCSGEKQDEKALKPYRGAMEFEKLRLAVDRSGKRPRAFMLTVGSLAFARARAQFSGNFFGCAGIEPVDSVSSAVKSPCFILQLSQLTFNLKEFRSLVIDLAALVSI